MRIPKFRVLDRGGLAGFLVVLAMILATAAGCASGGGSAVQATAAPAPTGEAAKEMLVTALKAQLSQKAWQVTVSAEDAGTKSTSRVEFITPDRFHAVDPDGSELIVVKGAGTFQKAAGGRWERSPMDMSDSITALMDPQQNESLGANLAVEQVKFLGAEALDGRQMWTYQYQATNNFGEVQANYTTKIWIGVADKLPYKEESEGESATIKGGRMKQTVIYGYSSAIKIEPPIK